MERHVILALTLAFALVLAGAAGHAQQLDPRGLHEGPYVQAPPAPPFPPAARPRPNISAPRPFPGKPPIPPDYPEASLQAAEQGKVHLEIWVLDNARVGDARLRLSSGFARLDQAALAAARSWVFIPGTVDDAAVSMWWRATVDFRIEAGKPVVTVRSE